MTVRRPLLGVYQEASITIAVEDEQEHKERPRPRVIDKRVSARAESPPVAPKGASIANEAPAPVAPPAAPAPEGTPNMRDSEPSKASPSESTSTDSPPTGGTAVSAPSSGGQDSSAPSVGGEVWTPQQEEEMRRVAQQIAETPSLEWVLNTAVTLANVAGTKLDLGATADAQLAIDALAALINGLGAKLADAETPLRQTLAQLQMAYATQAGPPPVSP